MFTSLVQIIGISICWTILIVNAQLYQSQGYAYNRRQQFNSDQNSNSGLGPSRSPSNDFVFPDDQNVRTATVNLIENERSTNKFIERHKPATDELVVETDKLITGKESCSGSCVPLDFLSGIDSYDKLFQTFDEDSKINYSIVQPRLGDNIQERSNIVKAEPAVCIPELQTVPIEWEGDLNDPNTFIFPTCTRVKRCGGCCTTSKLSCQPVETNSLMFSVVKYRAGKRKNYFVNVEAVTIEEHTKCHCDCKKKKTDCTSVQRYEPALCDCICKNTEDKRKCSEDQADKIWDSDTCSCKCREEFRCSSDTYFDPNTCACIETPGHRHTQLVDRKRLITKPMILIPQTPETYYDSDIGTE